MLLSIPQILNKKQCNFYRGQFEFSPYSTKLLKINYRGAERKILKVSGQDIVQFI